MTTYTPEQSKKAVDDMVSKMISAVGAPKEVGFTLGWDVVVSYSEAEINKILHERYNKANSKIVKEVKVDVKIKDPRTRKLITRHYSLVFGAPEIQFHGATATEPSCELSMPIVSGSFTETDSKGHTDDEAYPIDDNAFRFSILGIRLGTITGKYNDISDGENRTAENLNVVSGRTTIEFPTEEEHTSWVVLNIPVSGDALSVKVTPIGPSAEDLQLDANYLEGVLKSFFLDPRNLDVIEYSLASVNNQQDQSADCTNDLRPVSFQFTTFSSSYHQDSILSLMIETSAGNNTGLKEDLQSSWAGQWVSNQISPIPHGYTSSIIMNPALVYSAMLGPGMKKAGYNTIRSSSKPDGIGITATKQGRWTKGYYAHKYSGSSQLETPGFDVDWNDFPMLLNIKQTRHDEPPVIYIKWTVFMDTFWKDVTQESHWYTGGTRVIWSDDSIRTTYVMDRDFPCTVVLNDKEFSINIDTSSSDIWNVTFSKTPNTENFLEFLDIDPPSHATAATNQWLKDLKPPVNISSMGLGFFRTTNLLLPGSEVIDIDESVGVRVPKDLLLVGTLKKSD